MSRTLQFLIFLSIFLSLYGAMHFYVLRRLCTLFSLKKNLYFYLVLFVFTFSYLGAVILERRVANAFSRIVYIAASVIMGVVFILFSLLLVYEIVRLFFKIPQQKAGIAILCIGGILALYSLINAARVRVKQINIKSKKVSSKIDIVQIADLHFGPIRNRRFLQKVVNKINKLNPDLICITGDLMDGPYHYKMDDFSPLNDFNAPVFFVTGNHERYAGLDNMHRFLKNTPVRILEGETVSFNDIMIIGVGDSDKKEHLEKELSTLDIPSSFSLLLYHRPVPGILKTTQKFGIDLSLCGHVHAGQIFPFELIVAFFYRPTRGLHKYKGSRLYVSPGTGTWGPPMRLGSHSEITLLRVEPEP